jgi:hypothetical protein
MVCVYIQIFSLVRVFVHVEGYLVKIIIVTPSFRQDLNISDSKLSLSSYENHGTASLNDPNLFLHFCDYPPLKRTWTFI